MIDYRIYTFLTLYREMNYRKTAELLNMTQPGVTQHIHFLEKAYHTKLFQYDGKSLSRTHSADLLKRSIERMLSEEAALKATFQASDKYHLRVGATKTIGEFAILPMAAAFAKAPGNQLDLVIDNTEVLLAMLEGQQLDFAFIEGFFDKSKFDYHLFQQERFVGVCQKAHPFAGKCVPLEEVLHETLILREQGSGTRSILEQLLKDRNFSLDCFPKVITINNFAAIRHFVAEGIGITFAYRPVAEAGSRLACFTLEHISVVHEFNCVYLNRNTALEQTRRFAANSCAGDSSE